MHLIVLIFIIYDCDISHYYTCLAILTILIVPKAHIILQERNYFKLLSWCSISSTKCYSPLVFNVGRRAHNSFTFEGTKFSSFAYLRNVNRKQVKIWYTRRGCHNSIPFWCTKLCAFAYLRSLKYAIMKC